MMSINNALRSHYLTSLLCSISKSERIFDEARKVKKISDEQPILMPFNDYFSTQKKLILNERVKTPEFNTVTLKLSD